MSLWGVHVGIALVVTAAAMLVVTPRDAVRVVALGASAWWAVVPDLYHLVPSVRPWYKPLLHDSALADVFWLHGLVDDLDPTDSRRLSLAVGGAGLLAVVALEVALRRREM